MRKGINSEMLELVDAADSKPACPQAGLPPARVCWFDSSPGHKNKKLQFSGAFLIPVIHIVRAGASRSYNHSS